MSFQTVRGKTLLLGSSYCRSDHRVAQVRKDDRRSLGKPPAWSRVSYKVRPGCSGLFPVRTLPHLNLPNFSVTTHISIASCLPPSTPRGLSFCPPPVLQAKQASASHQSMCSGLSLAQWQFNKLAPHLPCIWVRSEAGSQSNFRGTCIYSCFVHWSCRLLYGICLTSSKIVRRSPIDPPNWCNPATRGKHHSPKNKLLSVNPQTWSGLEERCSTQDICLCCFATSQPQRLFYLSSSQRRGGNP